MPLVPGLRKGRDRRIKLAVAHPDARFSGTLSQGNWVENDRAGHQTSSYTRASHATHIYSHSTCVQTCKINLIKL